MKLPLNVFAQQPSATPTELAACITRNHATAVTAIRSIMLHPRSLARPIPTWRPPSKKLPAIPGGKEVTLTLQRHRVGAPVLRRLYRSTDQRKAAYLVTCRMTCPHGQQVHRTIAEAWIQAIVGVQNAHLVHELLDEYTPTYVWLVDGNFDPLFCPASLFQNSNRAA